MHQPAVIEEDREPRRRVRAADEDALGAGGNDANAIHKPDPVAVFHDQRCPVSGAALNGGEREFESRGRDVPQTWPCA
jgi:hypothetical protein